MPKSHAQPEIIRKRRAVHIDKPEGTSVDYYIFPEYEVHYNEIASGTVQQWHHHEAIEETVLVMRGELELRWQDGAEFRREALQTGDVVRVGRSVHTFANTTGSSATFVVFRLVLDGTDKREMIKKDKVVDEGPTS